MRLPMAKTELLHVAFGNVLAVNRVVAIVNAGSAPVKRMIREARTNKLSVDMTNGRKTKAVVVLDSGHIVLSPVTPETLANRLSAFRSSGASVERSEERRV